MANTTWSTTDKVNVTLTNANLTATLSASNGYVRGKDPKRTGKYYFESTCGTYAAASTSIGVGTGFATGNNTNNASVAKSGAININNATSGSSIAAQVAGNVVGVAVDLDARFIWFRVAPAGNWNGNAGYNPATGVGGVAFSVLGAGPAFDFYPMFSSAVSADAETANFGATAFTGAVPSGFTSGWDDSVAAVSNVVATSMVLEEWGVGVPAAQLTNIFLEQWAQVSSVNTQVVLTSMFIEEWASLAAPTVPTLVDVPSGAVTFTGFVPGVPVSLAVQKGAVAFTGYTLALGLSVAAGAPGRIAFTGYPPHLGLDLATGAPGQIVFTGYRPFLNLDIGVGVGSVVMRGRAPATRLTVAPGLGTVTVTGHDLTYPIELPVGTGSIRIFGHRPVAIAKHLPSPVRQEASFAAPKDYNDDMRTPRATGDYFIRHRR